MATPSDALMALLKWRKGDPSDSWRGDDLRVYAELTFEGQQTTPEALLYGWAQQLCTALNVLHTQEWVHGDVSPANILIDEDRATLIDFDLACPIGAIPAARDRALRLEFSSGKKTCPSLRRYLFSCR